MAYTVYVDEVASYVAASHEHARELAEPYVGLGRTVEIRHHEAEMPTIVWRYDYGAYEWIQSTPVASGTAATERR